MTTSMTPDTRRTTFRTDWCYQGQPTGSVEVTTDAENLHDILAAFESFLKGCGFEFSGHVRLMEDDDLP